MKDIKFNIPEPLFRMKETPNRFVHSKCWRTMNNGDAMFSDLYTKGVKAIKKTIKNPDEKIIDYPKCLDKIYAKLGFDDFSYDELIQVTDLFFNKNGNIVKSDKFKGRLLNYLRHKAKILKDDYELSVEQNWWRNVSKAIIIYDNDIPCNLRKHKTTAGYFIIPSFDNKQIKIRGYYCTSCKRLYISRVTYEHDRAIFKFMPNVFIGNNSEKVEIDNSDTFYTLNMESALKKNGYCVDSKTDLSDVQRQIILDGVIEFGIVPKDTVINIIRSNIARNKDKAHLQTAIKKWQRDLEYVINKNYILDPKKEVYRNITFIPNETN